MKNSLTQITLLILFSLALVTPSMAQQVATPNGTSTFVNSGNSGSGNGGQLAQIQSGTLGSFTPGDRWIGIGNPFFAGSLLPVYGMRIQDSGQAATVSLNNNIGPLDFELQWGNDPDSKFRVNFINDPTNPSNIVNLMTGIPNGNIGIDDDNPTARLSVNVDAGESVSEAVRAVNQNLNGFGTTSSADRIGVYGQVLSIGAGGKVASTGAATSSIATSNYGVSGFASDGTDFCVGVYGSIGASTATTAHAGYFNGSVFSTGGYLPSDRRLKQNITTETNVMDRIMQLRATTYEFDREGKFSKVNFMEGTQHGFIAQELEEVFPDMVKEQNILLEENIYTWDEEGMPVMIDNPETMTIKTVNYDAMIPVLTKGIQEQQGMIDVKDAEIAELRAENATLTDRMGAMERRLAALEGRTMTKAGAADAIDRANVLYQNTPNPFSAQTEIRYELTDATQNAEVLVFDMNGRQLRSFSNLKAGSNSLVIDGSELEAGMYFYSLIVNGAEVDTKRMILTK